MKVILLITVEEREGSRVVEIEHACAMADLYAVGDQLLIDHPALEDRGPATVVLRRFYAAGETACGPALVRVYATIPLGAKAVETKQGRARR